MSRARSARHTREIRKNPRRRVRRFPHNALFRHRYAEDMQLRLSIGAILLVAVSACATGPGYIAENPIWNTQPTVEDVMRNYPRELARVPSDRATLQCEVLEDGVLDHCRVLQAPPPGYAFAPPR